MYFQVRLGHVPLSASFAQCRDSAMTPTLLFTIVQPLRNLAVIRNAENHGVNVAKRRVIMLQTHADARPDSHTNHRYHVCFAQSDSEIRAAQKLRHQVFTEEFGAHLNKSEDGLDVDDYDPHCQHLIVRDEVMGCIVGTYRVLSPDAARCIGSYYSENEFILTRLAHLRTQLVEIGRTCIAADHRNGAVIAMLWFKLAEYMKRNGHQYLIGCASIPMPDGGHNAANLFMQLGEAYMAPVEYRVMPHVRLPYERLTNGQVADVPPLVKGYLRAGAWICGEPAWDPDFNSTDLLMLLPMARMTPRYQRHFMRS
jgi:putative hemolysin